MLSNLPDPRTPDPVIAAYFDGIDMSLVEENLKLSHAQRVEKAETFIRSLDAIRGIANQRQNQTDNA